MRFIKLFEDFDNLATLLNIKIGNTNIDNDLLNKIKSNHMNDGITDFIKIIKNLEENGGNIYRLVFLYGDKKIKKNDIGHHFSVSLENLFNIEESLLQGFIDNFEDELPDNWQDKIFGYYITLSTERNNIDVGNSIIAYNYHEKEINVIDKKLLTIQKVDKYKMDTDDFKSIRESIKIKKIHGKGGGCKVYNFLNQKDKVIKLFENDRMLKQHVKIFNERPDIFPIVYMVKEKYIILEKLNDRKAKKDITEMINYYKDKYKLMEDETGYLSLYEILDHIVSGEIESNIKDFKIDKYEKLLDRLRFIKKEILKFYNKTEYYTLGFEPDMHHKNFGYDNKGILKMLDI